jgi:purine catabolism regulator
VTAEVFPSVEAVLRLDVIRAARPRVLAGADHLDRAVRSVHATAIRDIARFLTGGELLLTAGQGIPAGRRELVEFVHELRHAGAAGMVVELAGRVHGDMPQPLVEAADGVGLVLVATGAEFSFSRAAADYAALVGELNRRRGEAAQHVIAPLVALLSRTPDLDDAVEEIGRRTGCTVVIQAAGGGAGYVGHHPPAGTFSLAQDHCAEHASTTPHPSCSAAAIPLRGRVWGMLHLLGGSWEAPARDDLAEQVAQVLALMLSAELADNAGVDGALKRLVAAAMAPDADRRALGLRIAASAPALRNRPCLVLCLDRRTDGIRHLRGVTGVAVGWLAVPLGTVTVLLLPLEDGADPRAVAENVMNLHGASVRQARVGAATAGSAHELGHAIRDAEVARQLPHVPVPGRGVGGRAVFLRDRPLDRLLSPMMLDGTVRAEAGRLLTSLLECADGPLLLETLRVLSACAWNRSVAATRLDVDRRTVQKRLRRVEHALGVSLTDPDLTTALAIALRVVR